MSEQDWFHIAEWQLGDRSRVVRRTAAMLERHAGSHYCATGVFAAAAWSDASFDRELTFEVTPAVRPAVIAAATSEFRVFRHADGGIGLEDDRSNARVSVSVGPRAVRGAPATVWGLQIRALDLAATMADRMEAFTGATGIPRLMAGHQILALVERHPEFGDFVPTDIKAWAMP